MHVEEPIRLWSGEHANTVAEAYAGSVLTCKSFAGASPRASPKWHPGSRLQHCPNIIHPPLRLEGVGILEVAFIMVHAWRQR